MVTWGHSAVSQRYRIKGLTTDEAFQEQSFLWERGAFIGADLNLSDSQDNLWDTEIKENNEKAQLNPINCYWCAFLIPHSLTYHVVLPWTWPHNNEKRVFFIALNIDRNIQDIVMMQLMIKIHTI